jgi:polysaccharide export outer membrane protein
MRAGFRSLCCGAVLIAACWGQTADAQLPIDPSVLSQLSPEERQQLLQGFGGGNSASTSNQDKVLDQPETVYPRQQSQGDDGDYGSYDAYSDVGAVVPDGRTRSRSASSGGSISSQASEGTFANPRRQTSTVRRSGSGNPDELDGQDRIGRSDSMARVRSFSRGKVRPFGYELFSGVPSTFAPATDIPVPSDYVIGPGDNVRIQLFGNQNETFTLLVSRDGTINFPKLGPITTTGLRFDELQSMLEQRVSKEMIGTTASVTLGRLRSIRVFVLGDVTRPGSYTLSSLSTMTHALFVSGGVSTVGSLRHVQLKRQGRVVQSLDLYHFLLGGDSSNDVRLQPGDVVFVPPVGQRVTVQGEVKRPAIYELSGERSLADVIALAGGRQASSDQTYVEVERVTPSAERTVLNFDMAKPADQAAPIHDGDVVQVRKIARQISNEIRVAGAVKYPGSYPWTETRELRSVLDLAGVRASDARSEVYLPMGAIERTNSTTGIREFFGFNVANVMDSTAPPLQLQSNDLILIFGRDDIAYLSSYEVEAVLGGKNISGSIAKCSALTELRGVINSQRAVRFLRTLSSESNRLQKLSRPHLDCPEIFQEVPRALPFLLDKSVGIYGEAGRPGVYPVADDTPLELLIQAAGGVTSESDPRNVEYISYVDSLSNGRSRYQILDLNEAGTAAKAVSAGDILNLRPVFLDQEIGSVRLIGEVRFPGTYSIVRGETMSQVIDRAGGLTDNAFPYGAVFTRESARKAEAASFKRAATDLQEAVTTVISSGSLTGDVSSVAAFLTATIKRLETAEPVGRVVVQADPAVLRVRPEQNVFMESGDVLAIPKRPTSVTVAGQVLNPGTQMFVAGDRPQDYIERAGGTSLSADKKRAFVVYPDGSAKPLKLSAWNFESQDIPPGSLIIIPRNAAPLNKLLLSERILSIFSNLAISAAALVTINNN